MLHAISKKGRINSRTMSWEVLVVCMGEKNTHGVLVGEPEGNGKLAIPCRRW
jgi:hypothetical protein